MHMIRRILCMAQLLVFIGSCLPDEALCGDMVEITIEVTEVNASKANELGIKWLDTIQAGEVAFSAAGRVPETLPEIPSIVKVGEWSRYTPLSADLKMLQEKGAAQVLAKPKILTKSGSTARFLVGGEFPIAAIGQTTTKIEWKEYGIKTEIRPKILDDGTIDLTLTTEVSRLDWANAVLGYPAITKREATSSIQLKSEQTLTMAGLIQTSKDKKTTGIPLLSDIPLLGHLFGRKITMETKTNVIIFVTPRIVE